jgi:hypothetical protein
VISYVTPVLLAIVGLSFAALLLWQYPTRVGLIAMATAIGLDCLQVGTQGIDLGITVYADDIACLALLSAGLMVALRRRKLPERNCWPLFLLFALTAINLARGVSEFGLKPAGNGARSLGYLIVPPLSFVLLRPALRLDPQRIAKWLSSIGFALAVLAAARWTGLLPTPQEITENDFREVVRVLPAGDAMILGQGLLAIVFLQVTRGMRCWGVSLAGILAITAVALQHRSVWLSLLVGVMWLAARSFPLSQKVWLQLAAGAFVGLTIAATTLIAAGGVDKVLSLGKANFDETQQDNSTWSWRVQGFAEATDRIFSSDLLETLLGPPSGRDLSSDGNVASIHVHSRYVGTLAYYGIVGLTGLIAWLSIVSQKVGGWAGPTQGETCESRLGRIFLQALLLSQLTYLVAYSGEIMQGGVIALIWLASDFWSTPFSAPALFSTGQRSAFAY